MENLLIDGFFLDLVRSPRLPPDEHEIVLHNDGSWEPLTAKKDDVTKLSNKPTRVYTTNSNLVIKKIVFTGQTASKRPHSDSVDCITLVETNRNDIPFKKRIKLSNTYSSSDIVCIDID